MTVYTISAHQGRLDAVFSRASVVAEPQSQADFARYLCVLVSGFIEQAVRKIYGNYADKCSNDAVARHVEANLESFTNANAEKLLQLAGSFKSSWRKDLDGYLAGERKDAIDSVLANRHNIVHGRDVGITYPRINDWYDKVKEVISFIEIQTV